MPLFSRAAIVLAALLLMPMSAFAGSEQITGTALYRERIALPPNAVFTAVLEDSSRQDVAAVEIARTVVDPAGHPPYRFTIAYDPTLITEGHTYTVRANIHANGQLMFTSDTAHPVLTRGAGTSVEIVMKMVAGRAGAGGGEKVAVRAAPFTGMVTYMADAALFFDCTTGRRLPIAMEAQFPDLERVYRENASAPGAPLQMTLEGMIAPRPKMEGEGEEPAFIVLNVVNAMPGEACEPLPANPDLVGTHWVLVQLEGEGIPSENPMGRQPFLRLLAEGNRYSASAGCNGLGGAYELSGDKLTLKPGMSTMMACPPPVGDWESGLKRVLAATARYRLNGRILALLDAEGQPLARFLAGRPE